MESLSPSPLRRMENILYRKRLVNSWPGLWTEEVRGLQTPGPTPAPQDPICGASPGTAPAGQPVPPVHLSCCGCTFSSQALRPW